MKIEAENAEARSDLARAAEIRYGEIPTLQKEFDLKLGRLKKLQKSRRILKEEITEEDIAEVVARWTGIPLNKMLEGEKEKLLRIEEELRKRVVGQDEAIKKKLEEALAKSQADLEESQRKAKEKISEEKIFSPEVKNNN